MFVGTDRGGGSRFDLGTNTGRKREGADK